MHILPLLAKNLIRIGKVNTLKYRRLPSLPWLVKPILSDSLQHYEVRVRHSFSIVLTRNRLYILLKNVPIYFVRAVKLFNCQSSSKKGFSNIRVRRLNRLLVQTLRYTMRQGDEESWRYPKFCSTDNGGKYDYICECTNLPRSASIAPDHWQE